MQYAKNTRMLFYVQLHFAVHKPVVCFKPFFCPTTIRNSRRYVGGARGALVNTRNHQEYFLIACIPCAKVCSFARTTDSQLDK